MTDDELIDTHGRDATHARSITRLETIIAIAARIRRRSSARGLGMPNSGAIEGARIIVEGGTDTLAKFRQYV